MVLESASLPPVFGVENSPVYSFTGEFLRLNPCPLVGIDMTRLIVMGQFMPRHNYPQAKSMLHSGQLAYYAVYRKTRAELRKQERRAQRHSQILDKRQAEYLDRRETQASHVEKRIDKLERYPSKRAVELLQEIAKSRKTPAAQRARAAAILLKWSEGDWSHGKRRRTAERD